MAPPRSSRLMGWRGLAQSRRKRPEENARQRQAQLAQARAFRAGLVMAFLTALTLILGYRLFYWQVLHRAEILERAQRPVLEQVDAQPRGAIRDRNGYLLATDTIAYKFGVSPNILSYPETTARDVSEITGIPAETLEVTFSGDEQYVVISDTLPYTTGQRLVLLENNAFKIEPVLTRAYPEGPVASHLLGFVNGERRGLAGVELFYDDLLQGKEELETRDTPPAEEIKLGNRPFNPTRNGIDLILTLDRSIQFMAEQELEQAVREFEALGGTIIVMEPKSGELLAMASYPAFDPNHYIDYLNTPEIFQNPAVQREFEPGSIFKMITVAAALDAGVVAPDTVYVCQGVIEVGGRLIRNWDGRAYGPSTITQILGYSLNTGTAWLSTTLGADRFYSHLSAFGFGEPTGVDLGSEARGFVKHPGDGIWHASDLGTNAFGQGIAVTPIQMISAAASLLNDGALMEPHIVKAIVNRGHLEEVLPRQRGQTVSPAVARTMQAILADAVEMETEMALLDGWRIGGKTGTAQVPIPGGYHATDTIASFIGFAPADDPAFIMLVKLDRPLGVYQWGSQSAAPVFQRLAQRILNYYNIPPDSYRMAAPAPAPEQSMLGEAPTP